MKLRFGEVAPRINALEITRTSEQITVFLAGDSTVTDVGDEKGFPFSGWGQMLQYYFKHDVAVANHAVGGRSSKSFIQEGRLDDIMEEIKEGDYLFIQFGHKIRNGTRRVIRTRSRHIWSICANILQEHAPKKLSRCL